MKRLLAVMVGALLFGVPLLVVLGWRLSAVLLTAWLGVLTIAVLVAKAIDLVRERDELEIDNRSMRQRLTVARALIEGAIPYVGCITGSDDDVEPIRRVMGWSTLCRAWINSEDADPHVVAMRDRVERLKAQRELDAIRS